MSDKEQNPTEARKDSSRSSKKVNIYIRSEQKEDVFPFFLEKLNASSYNSDQLARSNDIAEAELIILIGDTEKWMRRQVSRIRSESASFLTPTMALSEKKWSWLDDVIDFNIQSPLSGSDLISVIGAAGKIQTRLEKLGAIPDTGHEASQNKLLLLRYLHSRDKFTLRPRRDYRATVGYSISLAQLFLKVGWGEEIAFLAGMKDEQLLSEKLIDKVNLCPYCSHAQINFREICPKCESLKIEDEATIHHFQCANVGRESDYVKGAKLICPKCNNELRHIGVDYDKPSEVLWCATCNHNFADPKLDCLCLACGRSFKPEDANIGDISEYSISEMGIRAAAEGVLPGVGLMSLLKKEFGFYKKEVFTELLQLEMARCQRYKFESTVARFTLRSAGRELELGFFKNSRKFRKDFAAIMTETFRTTDVFTELSGGNVLLIFTNTDLNSSDIAFDRLQTGMEEKLSLDIEVEYENYSLVTDVEQMNSIWEKLK